MKICVTGSFGARDIGDDAMVFPHLKELERRSVEKLDIWLIGHKPRYMAQHFSHPRNRCISSAKPIPPEVIEGTSGLLVTGGGTINTRAGTDGRSIKRMHELVMPFVRKNIPVFMSGQTIGPLGINPEHDQLAREIIAGVDVLTVRDKRYSREYIEKIGAKPKVFVETADDAACIEYKHETVPIGLPEGRKALVNITLYTYDTPAKRTAVRQLCLQLEKSGYHVLLLPHATWDYGQLKALQASLPSTTLINTVDWRGAVSKKLMSQCDLVVGGRYHVVVFAMTAQVPCVGMAGNHYSWIKQRGFAEQAGLGGLIVPPGDITNVDKLMMAVGLAIAKHPATDEELPTSGAPTVWHDWWTRVAERGRP